MFPREVFKFIIQKLYVPFYIKRDNIFSSSLFSSSIKNRKKKKQIEIEIQKEAKI